MNELKQRRLLTVSQWNKFHAWPTPGGLRHLIFYASANGFERALRRAGRRILIDENEFFDWLDQQQKNPKSQGTRQYLCNR